MLYLVVRLHGLEVWSNSYQALNFMVSVGSNPVADRNLSVIFFLYRRFQIFFFRIMKEVFINYVDTFLKLFHWPNHFYRNVSTRIYKASSQWCALFRPRCLGLIKDKEYFSKTPNSDPCSYCNNQGLRLVQSLIVTLNLSSLKLSYYKKNCYSYSSIEKGKKRVYSI